MFQHHNKLSVKDIDTILLSGSGPVFVCGRERGSGLWDNDRYVIVFNGNVKRNERATI